MDLPGATAATALCRSRLRWWLLLLAQLVRNGGAALLPHMGTLRAVLRAAGHATQPKVLKAAYKLRRRLLHRRLLYTASGTQPELSPADLGVTETSTPAFLKAPDLPLSLSLSLTLALSLTLTLTSRRPTYPSPSPSP